MKYLGTPVDWPLDNNIIRNNSVSNTFGMVRRNRDGSPKPHQGWDLYASVGTPCYSIADGEVDCVIKSATLGLYVVISIGNTGKYVAYAHLASALVMKGHKVKLGEMIGHTGNSGNASDMTGTDEHLHFEIRDKPITGLGLADRISPVYVFGACPVKLPILRNTSN